MTYHNGNTLKRIIGIVDKTGANNYLSKPETDIVIMSLTVCFVRRKTSMLGVAVAVAVVVIIVVVVAALSVTPEEATEHSDLASGISSRSVGVRGLCPFGLQRRCRIGRTAEARRRAHPGRQRSRATEVWIAVLVDFVSRRLFNVSVHWLLRR